MSLSGVFGRWSVGVLALAGVLGARRRSRTMGGLRMAGRRGGCADMRLGAGAAWVLSGCRVSVVGGTMMGYGRAHDGGGAR